MLYIPLRIMLLIEFISPPRAVKLRFLSNEVAQTVSVQFALQSGPSLQLNIKNNLQVLWGGDREHKMN